MGRSPYRGTLQFLIYYQAQNCYQRPDYSKVIKGTDFSPVTFYALLIVTRLFPLRMIFKQGEMDKFSMSGVFRSCSKQHVPCQAFCFIEDKFKTFLTRSAQVPSGNSKWRFLMEISNIPDRDSRYSQQKFKTFPRF